MKTKYSKALLAAIVLATLLAACGEPKYTCAWKWNWFGWATDIVSVGEKHPGNPNLVCQANGEFVLQTTVTITDAPAEPVQPAAPAGSDTTSAPVTNGNDVAYMSEDLGLNVYNGTQLNLSALPSTSENQIYLFHGDTGANGKCQIVTQTGTPKKPSAATWRLLKLTFSTKPDQNMINGAINKVNQALGACTIK